MKLLKKKVKKETGVYSVFAVCDVKEQLDNWAKLIPVMKKLDRTDKVEDTEYIYFKVYYIDFLSVEDKNEIFISISSLPLNKGTTFLGVREYLENHEMCFVFKKGK